MDKELIQYLDEKFKTVDKRLQAIEVRAVSLEVDLREVKSATKAPLFNFLRPAKKFLFFG